MKKILLVIMALVAITAGYSFAAMGTTDQAKANVDAAVKFYETNGQAKAFAEFNDNKGKFVKGDLYVFVADLKGNILAHGANQKLVGQSLMELKDPNGKLFMVEMVELAKSKGSGWVDYMWSNPETKKIAPKSTYILRIKNTDYFVGCGAYK